MLEAPKTQFSKTHTAMYNILVYYAVTQRTPNEGGLPQKKRLLPNLVAREAFYLNILAKFSDNTLNKFFNCH